MNSKVMKEIEFFNVRHTEHRSCAPGTVVRTVVLALIADREAAVAEGKATPWASENYVPYFIGSHVFDSQGEIIPKAFITFVRAHLQQDLNHNTINRTRQKTLRSKKLREGKLTLVS